jgi:hypothetical protein
MAASKAKKEAEAAEAPARDSWHENLVLTVAGALALAGAVRFSALQVPVVEFPYAVNYGEGVVLDQAVRIARGPGLYTPLAAEPYVVDNYTPLYPYLASLALPSARASFHGGRVISFGACLATAVVLYAMAFVRRRKEASQAALVGAGVIAAGLYLASGEALNWGALYRVDCLGVALSVAGFALAASSLRSGPLLAAPLFVAALAVRQSLIAAPAAAYLAAVLRRRRQGLWGLAAFGALAAAGVVVGQAVTGGGFLTHTVGYNVLPFDAAAIWIKYLRPFVTFKVPLVAGAAWAWLVLRRDRDSLPFLTFAPLALLLALSIGRMGSDANYLLIPVAAMTALVARGVVNAPRRFQRVSLAGLAGLQLVVCLAFERPRMAQADLEAIAKRDSRLVEAISTVKGPVLFEEPSLALLSGRPVSYEPFMCSQLAAVGVWDPAPMVAAVRARRYAAIQRTAWLRGRDGEPAEILWLGDRTIPALSRAISEAYPQPPAVTASRPLEPGLEETYLLWMRPGG